MSEPIEVTQKTFDASCDSSLSVPSYIDRRVTVGAVVLLLSIHAVLVGCSAMRHSPTLNEPGHIVAGLIHWKYARFDVYCVNPPLVHYVAAIPIILVGYNEDIGISISLPGARTEFVLGERFISANRDRSVWLVTIARWVCIPFSLAGGLFCFLWSRDMWGSNLAGLLSLCVWCFEPINLAHAGLVTNDCAATSLGLGACYLFWRWLRVPCWRRAICTGIVLGLAELTKFTWIILVGVWPLLFICWWLPQWLSCGEATSDQKAASSKLLIQVLPQFAIIFLLALNILNLGYGFDGSWTSLKDFTFVSKAFTGLEKAGISGNRFARSPFGKVRMPVPKQYGSSEKICNTTTEEDATNQ